MIELSQSAQCLFCPQRRKLALLLKVALSGSAAIIMTLILFLPRTANIQPRQSLSESVVADPLESVNIPDDAMTQKSDEIRAQARKRHLEVQSQLKSLLVKSPLGLDEAKKLLEARQKEVLLTKVLVLGEPLFEGSGRAEGKRKIVLDSLEKEGKELAEQIELLTKME